MKSHYSDYVAHMVRLWLKVNGSPEAIERLDSVAKNNYDCTDRVLMDMESSTRLIITNIYSSINVNEAIKKLSEASCTKDTIIWTKVKTFEKELARARGLV